ncbi:unnamed protein product [Polarella glacialis]|uniref:Major facilitator superfamily (MFS) profile domain-containing protein n=1 Tax=Polarella glacialis TaxID=89957 RepID=A0A813FI78_POLGL|nr:unnamed protein product [Polarella glacialis]
MSLVAAGLKVSFLFFMFPETAKLVEPELDSGDSDSRSPGFPAAPDLIETARHAFRVLTRHSFIARMTMVLTMTGFAGSGYAIVMPPFMTGYLGFTRRDKLALFMSAAASVLITFLAVLGRLVSRFGSVRVLQMSLAAYVVFPVCCSACGREWHLVALVAIFAGPLCMAFPVVSAIKSNLVAQDEQGLVQGAIASIGKGTATAGFLLFSFLFALETHSGQIKDRSAVFLPFLVISGISLSAFLLSCSLPLEPPPPPLSEQGGLERQRSDFCGSDGGLAEVEMQAR